MRLSIVTGVCGALEVTEQWLAESIFRCRARPELVIVANGCTTAEVRRLRQASWTQVEAGRLSDAWVEEFPEPLGSSAAMNAGWRRASGDVVALVHNDLMVRDPDWDGEVLDWFARHPETGVVGFHGSKGLGSRDLYRTPYELTQLARGYNYSNLEDAEAHGARTEHPTEVVTLDGMALVARRADLEAWGGLDSRFPHHMYDHDLCLTARQHGRRNYLLPIRARHISGQTANHPRWNEHLRARGLEGGDTDVHRQTHMDFWLKWRGTGQLPARTDDADPALLRRVI